MSNIIKSFRVIDSNEDKYDEIEFRNKQKDLDEYKDKYIEIINKAKTESENIVERAKDKAIKIIEEAENTAEMILENANIKSQEIMDNSRQDGYNVGEKQGWEEGFTKGKEESKAESTKIIDEALVLKESNLKTRELIAKELEPDIINMILSISNKIIGKNLEDKEFILRLIEDGISKLDPTDDFTIIVSKNDYDMVINNKETILAGASFINNLNIKYDINFADGDCIFEMDKGNIDLSVQDQIEEVKKLVYKILNNE